MEPERPGERVLGLGMALTLACAPFAAWITPWRWSVSGPELLLLGAGLLAISLLLRRRAESLSAAAWAWLIFLLMAGASSLQALLRAHPHLDQVLAEQLLLRLQGRPPFDQTGPLYTVRALATVLVGAVAFGCARLAGRHEAGR